MRNNDDVMLLSAYLDGALSTDERTALEARLSSEPDLQEELEELRYVVGLLREMPLQKAPRSYALDPAIYGRKAAPVRKIIYPWRSLGAVAAAVVILMAGILFFASSGGDESMEQASDSVSQNASTLLSPTLEESQVEVANAPTPSIENEDRSEDADSGATALFYDTTTEATLDESVESEIAQEAAGLVQQAQATDQLVTPYDPFAAEGFDPEQQAMESGGVPPGVMPEGQTAPQAGGDVPPSLGAGAGGGGDAPVPFVSEMPAPMPTTIERDQEEDDAASISAASEAAAPAVPPSAADSPGDAAGESEPEEAANEAFADDDLARKTELFHQIFNALTGIFRRIDLLLGWNG